MSLLPLLVNLPFTPGNVTLPVVPDRVTKVIAATVPFVPPLDFIDVEKLPKEVTKPISICAKSLGCGAFSQVLPAT